MSSSDLPKIGLFGTGEKKYGKGGSGIKKLLERADSGDLQANIAVIVSNYENGGVRQKADDSTTPFHFMNDFPPRGEDEKFGGYEKYQIAQMYQNIVKKYDLDYVFFSGWLKYILGINGINIHPGLTHAPYGGFGMHGKHVHNKHFADYQAGLITHSAVTIHEIIDKIDGGPIVMQSPVEIEGCNDAEELGSKVNVLEHEIQWKTTQLIISGDLGWVDGEFHINPKAVAAMKFPEGTVFGGPIESNQNK